METEALIMAIQQGHTELMAELWERMRRLVAVMARQYFILISASGPAPGGVTVEDLTQCGYCALDRAVKSYTPGKAKFSTYLVYYIKAEFQTATGRTQRQRADPINRASSLDVPLNDEEPDSLTLMDTVPDPRDYVQAAEEKVFTEELHRALEDALAMIPESEATAIRSCFFDGQPQTAVAEQMGVSFQRVGQLRNSGLNHIRTSFSRTKLEQFLDTATDFYRKSSISRFNRTLSSVVEELALYREQLQQRFDNGQITRYTTITNQVHGHFSALDSGQG